MAEKIHNTTQGIVGDIKAGLHGIHGAGEALRGGAMEALDGVFHKRDGEAKDREIYERGVAEMRGTEERIEAREAQFHQGEHQPSSGHHHGQAGHGQGSHFADAHAKDAAATTARENEAESLGAAKLAWQEKH
jgi:hypothetical protein